MKPAPVTIAVTIAGRYEKVTPGIRYVINEWHYKKMPANRYTPEHIILYGIIHDVSRQGATSEQGVLSHVNLEGDSATIDIATGLGEYRMYDKFGLTDHSVMLSYMLAMPAAARDNNDLAARTFMIEQLYEDLALLKL